MNRAFNPRSFRDALSSFATGVTVITARDERGEPVGLTVSSFNSVSVEPPLILWSLAKSALCAPAFEAASHWAVHVLTTDQINLANLFATSGADKFASVERRDNAHGVPIIRRSAACFECRAWQTYDGGDHLILVGEVEKLDRQPGNPLVFCGGSFSISEPLRVTGVDHSEPLANELPEPIEDLLMYQLSRATRQMSALFHQRVSDSGLTIPEWRVLASLHGRATRELNDLSARTFIDQITLIDMVQAMAEQGLCSLGESDGKQWISGTQAGHKRVSHLFDEGASIEKTALGKLDDDRAIELKATLREIVRNT